MSIEFTHKLVLDPDWEPRDGQRWKDAPKARMKVTKMTKDAVYFTYANDPGNRGAWLMTRAVWDRDYAQPLPQATTEGEGS